MSKEFLSPLVTTDLDNTLLNGPPALASLLPNSSQHRPKTQTISTSWEQLKNWSFIHMNTTRRVKNGVSDFLEKITREAPLILLTGRPLDSQAQTVLELRKAGLLDFFEDLRLKNGDESAANHKKHTIEELANCGFFIIHFEDDPQAAFKIAEIGEDKTLVILLKSLVVAPFLKLNKMEFPPNIIVVDKVEQFGLVARALSNWTENNHANWEEFGKHLQNILSPNSKVIWAEKPPT